MIYTINLFAGPGAGKSTTAAGTFHLLKLKNIIAECVTEYAKELVYENRKLTRANQLYIFAKQHHRLWRLMRYYEEEGVDKAFIITDSPILLSLIYTPEPDEAFKELILEEFDKLNPINIFIERVKPYVRVGRYETQKQAEMYDEKIKDFLIKNSIQFTTVVGDRSAPEKIFEYLVRAGYL